MRFERREYFVAACALAAFFAFASGPARASGDMGPKPPIQQRWAQSELAFVGKVVSVRGDKVEFLVEHSIRGATQGKSATITAYPPSTSSISFAVGQRWIYSGASLSDPSALLFMATDKEPLKGMSRRDDSALRPRASWLECQSDSQCEQIPGACSPLAANHLGSGAMTRKIIDVLGDPKKMECAANVKQADMPAAWCVQNRCGQFYLER